MALHPGLVGQRVVVRTVLRGQTGPSGGPAMSDVLGQLESWSQLEIAVRRADGQLFRIRQADVVTAKPVPPRGSIRQRVPAADLQQICEAGWQAPQRDRLGAWVLRAGAGFTGRANSVLVAGDPGLPLEAALDRVSTFYARHDLPVLAQTVVGSDWLAELEAVGWIRAREHQPDALVQVASVAQARRVASGSEVEEVEIRESLTTPWLNRYGRASGVDARVVRAVLGSGETVAFAQIGSAAYAIGRAVVTGDWVGIYAVEVDPQRRRGGLGSAIVEALLEWAASRGALSAYLQVLPDNAAAVALYARYGFVTHHTYRYLRPPR